MNTQTPSEKVLAAKDQICKEPTAFKRGFLSGLCGTSFTPLFNPYDGRTKDGKEWNKGAVKGYEWLNEQGHKEALVLYDLMRTKD